MWRPALELQQFVSQMQEKARAVNWEGALPPPSISIRFNSQLESSSNLRAVVERSTEEICGMSTETRRWPASRRRLTARLLCLCLYPPLIPPLGLQKGETAQILNILAPELSHACCYDSIILWPLGDQEIGSEVVF